MYHEFTVWVNVALEKKNTRVRYVKFRARPLTNSRVLGGRFKGDKYGARVECQRQELVNVDLRVELEMGDVERVVGRGEARS